MNNQNTQNLKRNTQSPKHLHRLINSTGVQIGLGICAALLLWTLCRLAVPTNNNLASQTTGSTPRTSEKKIAQAQIAPVAFETTKVASNASPGNTPEGMAWIPGGTFSMGCQDPRGIPYGGDKPMTDAQPIHSVTVDSFWIDTTEVTNKQFIDFVEATEYNYCRDTPSTRRFSGAPQKTLSLVHVFTPPDRPVPLSNHLQWWAYWGQTGYIWVGIDHRGKKVYLLFMSPLKTLLPTPNGRESGYRLKLSGNLRHEEV